MVLCRPSLALYDVCHKKSSVPTNSVNDNRKFKQRPVRAAYFGSQEYGPSVEGLSVVVPAGKPESGGSVESSGVVAGVQEGRPQPRPHGLLHPFLLQQQLTCGRKGTLRGHHSLLFYWLGLQ